MPIQRPVAGIAMGMLLENNEYTCDEDVSISHSSTHSITSSALNLA